MLWTILPTWLATLILAFLLGYHFRGMKKKIEQLEEVVKSKVDKQPKPEEPRSVIIDELDPVQVALAEHERMMRRMNPQ